jgi:hypothetical protein
MRERFRNLAAATTVSAVVQGERKVDEPIEAATQEQAAAPAQKKQNAAAPTDKPTTHSQIPFA